MRQNSLFTYKGIVDYLRGKLTKKQQHDLEKEVMRHGFDSDAFDGLSELSANELQTDMEELQQRLQVRTDKKDKVRHIPVWLRIASVIVFVLGAGALIRVILINKPEEALEIAESAPEETTDTLQEKIPVTEEETPAVRKIFAKSEKKQDSSIEEKSEGKIAMVAAEEQKEISRPDYTEEETADEYLVMENEAAMESETEPIARTYAPVERNYDGSERREAIPKNIEDDLKGKVSGISTEDKSKKTIKMRGTASVREARPEISYSPDASAGMVVSGQIIDEDGSPLPGVNVVEKGTTNGAITDVNGNFQLTMKDTASSLQITYIGYIAEEIENPDSRMKVILAPDMLAIDEVVVVGYGTVKKSYMTGAVSTVVSEEEPEESTYSYPQSPFGVKRNLKQKILADIDSIQVSGIYTEHKVAVSFTVFKNGSVGQFEFDDDTTPELREFIENLIRSYGKWTPAKNNGIPVDSEVKIRLNFENIED
ncbi:MAG: carboxypeptidase-like regulatory domain-containing protein [Bacteroidales bacterium]|nr:carboxypeptidase-like regulatory domain-containing protein [Bacteroidales bacterium]